MPLLSRISPLLLPKEGTLPQLCLENKGKFSQYTKQPAGPPGLPKASRVASVPAVVQGNEAVRASIEVR